MFLSEYAVNTLNIDSRCHVLFTDVQNTLLIVPDANSYLVMDLSGKCFELPSVLAIKKPLRLELEKHAVIVVVTMPQNLKSNRLIDTGDGTYQLVDEWAEVAYVELLEQIHRDGKINPDNAKMLLTWNSFRAHKGYTELIQKYTRALMGHISEKRIDSRAMRRAFQQYFGRSPQQLQSYIKFNHSLHGYIQKKNQHLEHYTDQAHWIRVCKKYTGMTPRKIVSWNIVL